MGLPFFRIFAATTFAVSMTGFASAQLITPSGGNISVPTSGTLSLGCNALVVQGGFDVGPGQVNNTGNVNIDTGGVFNGGSGTLSVSGNWSNSGTFNAGTGSVVFIDGCATGSRTFTGNTVFNNLSLTSTTGRNFVIPSGTNITVNGTLTLLGTPGQPISLTSSAGQLAVINLGPGAQVIRNDVALGNVQIGAVTGVPTLSEYCLMLLAMLMAGSALWQQRQGTRRAAHPGNTK